MHWIKVKDKLPEQGQEVLVGYWDFVVNKNEDKKDFFFSTAIGAFINAVDGWESYDLSGYFERQKITHWFPIPIEPYME